MRTLSGGARNRQILLRERRLSTPSLFDLLDATTAPSDHDLRLIEHLYRRPPVYVLDVNVPLDLLKGRDRSGDVSRIVSAAMAGTVSLYASPEMIQELSKFSPPAGTDPALQFAASLPQFPVPPKSEGNRLSLELARLVFPQKVRQKNMKDRDRSDVVHLATAIHNRAAGFVTSEKAILRCRNMVWERFGLEIVGVTELAELLSTSEAHAPNELRATGAGLEIGLLPLQEEDRIRVERFLTALGLEHAQIREALAPGYAEATRRRFVLRVSGQLYGFASWDPPQGISSHVDAFISATVDQAAVESAVDSTLLALMKDASRNGPCVVRIRVVPKNPTVDRLATMVGFRPIVGSERSDAEWLQKVCLGRVVAESAWDDTRELLLSRAKVGLPGTMPAYSGPATPVTVLSPQGTRLCLPLHELEELIGPGLLVLPGRSGAIVPIRKEYAAQLLNVGLQSSLFPGYEASIISRRAYLSDVRALSATAPGTILLFYESQRGGGQAAIVACARAVESAISPTKSLPPSIKARGVLEDAEIQRVGASGKTGVTLFDSIFKFSKPVSLRRLRRIGCADQSNFVTSRRIGHEKLICVLREGMPHV